MKEIRFQIPIPVDGVRKDLPANAVPPTALIDSQNVLLRRGRFQPRYGATRFALNSPGQIVRGVVSAKSYTGTDILIIGTDLGWWLYSTKGTTDQWYDISGTALTVSNHILFRVFQKTSDTVTVGINDGVDVAYRYNSGAGGTYTAVGGTPPKAKAMMVLANRLCFYNLSANGGYAGVISPSAYDVSNFNDVDSGWGSVLNGILVDTPGPIVAALEMGDLQGVIYKSDAIIMQIAQGSTIPFRFEWRVIGNVGPANSRCVVQAADGSHIYLAADGDVRRFDGVSSQSLGYHVQKQIVDTADLTLLAARAFVVYDIERNEVVVHYYDRTSVNRRHAVITLENAAIWPMLWAGDLYGQVTAGGRVQVPENTGTEIVWFGTLGQAYKEVASGDQDSVGTVQPMIVYWESGPGDMGAPGYWKTLAQVDHLFLFGTDDPRLPSSGTATVTYTPRYCDGGDVPVSADAGQAITINNTVTNSYVTDHRATGKLLGHRYNASLTASSKFFEYRGGSGLAFLRGER